MPTSGFETFGRPHLVAMALTVAFPLVLSRIAQRPSGANRKRTRQWIGFAVAALLLTNEFVYWGYRIGSIGLRGFLENHLPLHLCGAAVLLTAATLLFRSRRTYEIAWFWGMVGALNAVITPGNLEVGFPEYRFFQYFIAHSGIVTGVLYATLGLGMRPDLSGLLRSFVGLNLFAAGVGLVNLVLGSNYMYLSSPPPDTASPFFFAPWPWYLLVLEFVGLAMFFVVLVPFLRRRRA